MAIQADIRIYGITELSQAARACECCASAAEMAWRIDTLFIFWDIGYTYFSVTSQVFYDSCHDDCLAISAIAAGKRQLRSSCTGLYPYPGQRPRYWWGVSWSQAQSSGAAYQPLCEPQLSPPRRSLDIWRPTCLANRSYIGLWVTTCSVLNQFNSFHFDVFHFVLFLNVRSDVSTYRLNQL